MKQVGRVIGAAGSGKTTLITEKMVKACSALGGDPLRLGFASFTRVARETAVTRVAGEWGCDESLLTKKGWFRTVHSTAYRCVGVQAGQLVTDSKADVEWISNTLGVKLSTRLDDEIGASKFVGDPVVAAALNCWTLARSSLTPLETVVRRARQIDDEVPDYASIVRISERYEQGKRLEDRLDFTDLLLLFSGLALDPSGGVERKAPVGDLPTVEAWLFDEQQDASPLMDACCKRLVSAPSVKWCYVVGDPFQCQPAGTPVLTAEGYKPIEKLDPARDQLIAFNKKDGRFYGTGGSVRFQKAWRDVDSGDLIEITFSDGTKSISTANHKWIVRTNRQTAFATYLMRKGTRWRVGTVQMFANWQSEKSAAKSGDFRLKMRMSQENADAAWVLKVCGTDREARMYEQIASCKYGIPQVTFRPPSGCRNNLDAEFIEGVFSAMGDLTANGLRCLADHGLEMLHPLCTKGDRAKNGSKACRFVQATNLLPGIHVAPKLLPDFFARRKRGSGNRRGSRNVGSECEWVAIESVRRLAPGQTVRVYSLEVERHHTYVTDGGIVTGNSIYGFAGSSAECFLGWEAAKEQTMPKSYRCPAPILELGERCLRRMYHGYFDRKVAPADHEGSVSEECDIDVAIERVDPRDSWLLIARTNYQASRLAAAMNAAGKPCCWTHKPDAVNARDEGLMALYALEKNEATTGAGWRRALELLPQRNKDKEPVLTRGTKTAWKDGELASRWDVVFQSDLESVGATESLCRAIRSGDWVRLVDRGADWRRLAERWGADLVAQPKVKVGTVHSVKGAEADNVGYLTTTSQKVAAGAEDAQQHDEECRIAYVAVTRAKRNLYVINEGGPRTPRTEVF